MYLTWAVWRSEGWCAAAPAVVLLLVLLLLRLLPVVLPLRVVDAEEQGVVHDLVPRQEVHVCRQRLQQLLLHQPK